MSKKKESRIGVRISKELHQKALEKAEFEDITISQAFRRFLRRWVEEPPKQQEDS